MTRPDWPRKHQEFYATEAGQRTVELESALLTERLPREGRVLSVGGGIGAHEGRMAQGGPGLAMVLLDIEPGMLAAAPRHLERVLGDALSLPFRQDAFDGVYFATSLEFLEEPDGALAEAARVLRPGGRLVVLALNPRSGWGRARLREIRPSWLTPGELSGRMGRATGGPVSVDFALLIEGGSVGAEAGPGDAAVMVLASQMRNDKLGDPNPP